jgi:hypothetical protein
MAPVMPGQIVILRNGVPPREVPTYDQYDIYKSGSIYVANGTAGLLVERPSNNFERTCLVLLDDGRLRWVFCAMIKTWGGEDFR